MARIGKHLKTKVSTAPKGQSGKSAYYDHDDNPLHAGKSGGVPKAPTYNHSEELEHYFESKFLSAKPSKQTNAGK
jgi:hypothetical protein